MKWKKLQHNGILFPPDFKSQGIKIKINGEHIDPSLIQEEMVYQWAKKKDAPKPGTVEKYVEDPVFQKNFISDFAKTSEDKFDSREGFYEDSELKKEGISVATNNFHCKTSSVFRREKI